MFIDATYEGDLMAQSRRELHRRPRGERQIRRDAQRHSRRDAQAPIHGAGGSVREARRPGSGLLPFIQAGDGGTPGEGDARVQAYNFRLCYTQDPANRLPHRKPAKYDPAKYELLARYLEALVAAGQQAAAQANSGTRSGCPTARPTSTTTADSPRTSSGRTTLTRTPTTPRARSIWQAHEDYIRGFVYFLATSPRVPENMRAEMQEWGPAKDEFLDTGGWPHQLYVREARRMVSDYVMTEHNCRGTVKRPKTRWAWPPTRWTRTTASAS